ncbi:MAG: hypothetical protein ACLFUI_04870 [Halanaerobiales bacterium]
MIRHMKHWMGSAKYFVKVFREQVGVTKHNGMIKNFALYPSVKECYTIDDVLLLRL